MFFLVLGLYQFYFFLVLGLHREFLRAGSDVMQAFTFYASDDKLDNRGNSAAEKYTGKAINMKAAELAKQVSSNTILGSRA